MLDHVCLQCADLEASVRFYDRVLAPLGGRRVLEFGETVGYGQDRPEFWISPQATGEGFRESHIAFSAASRAAVRAFFDAAVSTGAEVLHAPRLWPEYHENYFGAFVRDADGTNIEAVAIFLPDVRSSCRLLARKQHARHLNLSSLLALARFRHHL